MPYDEGLQVLILMARSGIETFSRSYVETLIDMELKISDEIREKFELDAVTVSEAKTL